ncbi:MULTISPECIES: mechanosensitive ion channel family protein [unclassified Flavobacterium]|uniref:mechanosensitive ion channel family protein n=1 Tax=unclassified Flavobacterium TaxID=196869 RepID=UPI001F092CB1|nr:MULTISPECIES: mechanosensitive ion channel family protein [unclassified Flavobacterium]
MKEDSLKVAVKDTITLAGQKEELINAVKPENVKDGIVGSVSEVSNYMEKFIAMAIDAIPAVIKAMIFLIVGLFIIRTVLKLVKNRFEKRNVDLSLRGFLYSIIKFILYAILALLVAGNLGFEITVILGALSGLVLAAGLALQGSLSNFAGGVLILLFRPFEVGDYIENSAGTEGTVDKIDLLYTSLTNGQGIKVFSPNGTLANSVIRNFSKITKRRVDFMLTISYGDNIQEVQKVIEAKLASNSKILQTPKPEIFVKELTPAGVVLTVRAWAEKQNYVEISETLQNEIKNLVYEGGFKNPYAAAPIHIINDTPKSE